MNVMRLITLEENGILKMLIGLWHLKSPKSFTILTVLNWDIKDSRQETIKSRFQQQQQEVIGKTMKTNCIYLFKLIIS